MKKIIIILLFSVAYPFLSFADFVFSINTDVAVSIESSEQEVVRTAFEMLSKDYQAVFGGNMTKSNHSKLFIGTLGNGSQAEKMMDSKSIQQLATHKEAYLIKVIDDKLYILGSDKRGTAYGILEISRKIGVSPWEWWADATIEKRNSFRLSNGFSQFEYPSVAYRGIFLNDEDWGITPWSYLTNEPSNIKGQIGPKTHARIFELLLRLRANMFWPAMHECSVAFYLTPGNKEMADKYGIVLGSSHCEPMMRNANAEWKIDGKGEYDYVHNKDNVLKFWESRVQQLKNSDNVYTLGIRGVHDGKMQGANTLKEQYDALTAIIKDQREMIAKNLNPHLEKVPQVFIPYKEVLDVYNMGLQVPDDVTLMWCDDNYGYIRHFPNEKERLRKGGNGVYYHISYWGRPHDYLWLSTNHPAQIYTQMKLAYDKGAQDMWILNVGDIKPGEYLSELFLDMAWNINGIENNQQGLNKHLQNWLSREFGNENAAALSAIMQEYYRLAYIRKPEFMGNTRTEEKDPKFKIVSDIDWSETEIKQRLTDYEKIANAVITLSRKIPATKQDAWFELVEYPVRAAAEMNKKHLYAQLARHGLAEWTASDEAYNNIVSLTQKYNTLASGKWNKMMDYKPRQLPAFDKLEHRKTADPPLEKQAPFRLLNGKAYTIYKGQKPLAHGLGYQQGAIEIAKNSTVEYNFNAPATDSICIELALAPNHPVDGKQLRYEISVDGGNKQIISYKTQDREEEWKKNVLTNRALKKTMHVLKTSEKNNNHNIQIKAIDEGVVLDQIGIFLK